MNFFDTAVIGAGMAGLGAARSLQAAGQRVVLLDKGRAVGGRVCSRHQDGCVFDHGAQNIKPGDSALSQLAPLLPPGLITRFDAPVNTHHNGTISPGDARSNAEEKWAARGGLAEFARALAVELPVWTSTRVSRLEESDGTFAIFGENSALLCRARSVILTPPAPQVADLLQASALRENAAARIEALRAARYHRCLSVMLRYDKILDADWYALLAENREHPLLWLARENAKGYVLSPQTGLVAQLGPKISEELYAATDDDVAHHTAALVSDVLKLPPPVWSSVKRWRYSQAHTGAHWADVNPPGTRLLVCGDALCEKSRVELAYESGLRAAQQLLAE